MKVAVIYEVRELNSDPERRYIRLDVSDEINDDRRHDLVCDLCKTLALLQGLIYDGLVDITAVEE